MELAYTLLNGIKQIINFFDAAQRFKDSFEPHTLELVVGAALLFSMFRFAKRNY